MFEDLPLFLVAATVCIYWATVAWLVVYKRLRHGRSAGVLPRHGYEWRLWAVIVPVICAWIALPILAGTAQVDWLSLPAWSQDVPELYTLRAVGAALAIGCYLLSVVCWIAMGRNWSMAIVPGKTQLVTTGLYGWVRHPIYSLSVALMLTSALVVSTLPMLVAASLHVIAMNLKAGHEEKHLMKTFGTAYVEYCQTAGRFWPNWSHQTRRLRLGLSSSK